MSFRPEALRGGDGTGGVVDYRLTRQAVVREYRKAAPKLSIALFVLTQHDRRTRHDRESLEIIQSQLTAVAPVSSTLGSRPAYYSDAQVEGMPISVYAPGSEADKEVRAVTAELLAVLEGESGG